MSTLYILQLQGGKYYVGKTNDVARRYAEHKAGEGSEWTKRYKPVKMLETRQLKNDSDETNLTKELMKKYGIDNVRGGAYCQMELPEYVRKTFQLETKSDTDCCFKCGEKGHFAKDCEESEDIWECEYCGNEFESESSAIAHERICRSPKQYKYSQLNEDDYGACFRCGRKNHWADNCYARTHVDGGSLDDSDDESE